MRINKKLYYCINNCGKTVSGKNRMCKSCANKGKNNPMFGVDRKNEKHPRWKGKKYLKYYCIDCNKEIYIGSKRCGSCCRKGKLNSLFNKHHKKESREKASITKGGTGIPYENNKYPEEFFRIRPKIRKRDNYTCQICHRKFAIKLHIHHIDYNKKNNEEYNLISLCNSCHIKTNGNRIHWRKYFDEKNSI